MVIMTLCELSSFAIELIQFLPVFVEFIGEHQILDIDHDMRSFL